MISRPKNVFIIIFKLRGTSRCISALMRSVWFRINFVNFCVVDGLLSINFYLVSRIMF